MESSKTSAAQSEAIEAVQDNHGTNIVPAGHQAASVVPSVEPSAIPSVIPSVAAPAAAPAPALAAAPTADAAAMQTDAALTLMSTNVFNLKQDEPQLAQQLLAHLGALREFWNKQLQDLKDFKVLFADAEQRVEHVFFVLNKTINALAEDQQLQLLQPTAKLLNDLDAQVREVAEMLRKLEQQFTAPHLINSNTISNFNAFVSSLVKPKHVQAGEKTFVSKLQCPLNLKNDLPVYYGATMDNLHVDWDDILYWRLKRDIETVVKLNQEKLFEMIESKFKGRDFEKLVADILSAQGFHVKLSPQGPDGGVDLVAVTQDEDYQELRLCVQVKSSINNTMLNVLTQLSGVMHKFKADYGLLVAWGGFEQRAYLEKNRTFFQIKMWDKHDIVKNFVECYSRLPLRYQHSMPLRKVWVLQHIGSALKKTPS